MTQEQIAKILLDYKILQQRTIDVVNLLHKSKLYNEKFPFSLDSTEDADSITFEDYDVYVSTSYRIWGGDWESVSCTFPIEYLTQSDKEILSDVCYKRDKELERKRIEKEENVRKENAEKEARELKQYEKLKAKFDTPTLINNPNEIEGGNK